MKTEEKIEMANELIVFASKRARDLIYAFHNVPSTLYETPCNVDFSDGLVDLRFEQQHRYADETYSARLTAEQIDMSEAEWSTHLSSVKEKRLQDEASAKLKKQEEEKANDLRQLNYLKNKLQL